MADEDVGQPFNPRIREHVTSGLARERGQTSTGPERHCVCCPHVPADPHETITRLTDRDAHAWDVLRVRTVHQDPWLSLTHEDVRLPNGYEIDSYNILDQPDFCEIIAITPDLQVPLVHQYKHGVQQRVLEFPAGLVDPGEAPSATARRELLEETGYAGEDPECIGRLVPNPTRSRNRAHFYVVTKARAVADPTPDVTESIEVELMSLSELGEAIARGDIASMGSVAGYWLARRAYPDLPWD